ncbi:uncharacterized protein [Coffea arabica]|uniref:Endonuclease/exonuclease/phosphatase domain-containing protein n=1 Tax=Coffea arabica TaxID=13443 RepID=A0ABM4X9N2_COFAR
MAEAFNIESLRLKLSFDFCLFNPSNKIWVFWRCGFHFNVVHNSEQVLHVMAGHDSSTETFFASFIYAKCTRVGRHVLWSELRALASSITRPWLVGGDFNAIRTLAEYTGRAHQDLGAISDFNAAISDCHLQELPYSGSSYTWSGVRSGSRIWKRLDRVLANHQWLSFLPNTSVQHLNRATSDHTPLLVHLRGADASAPKPFKFQNFWVSSSEFQSTVQSNWELPTQGYGMYRLAFKLKRMKACLRHWSRQHFGNIFQAVRQNEFEVQQKEILFEAAPTDEARAELHRTKGILLHSLRVEEDYWRQKARLRWLKDGDCNTRYFHASVREKRSKLAIHRIKDAGGVGLRMKTALARKRLVFSRVFLQLRRLATWMICWYTFRGL